MRCTLLLFASLTFSLAIIADARPGIWYRADGTHIYGSSSLACEGFFSLAAFGSHRLSCGDCSCTNIGFVVIVAKSGVVHANFDHTLGSVEVDGTTYDIPSTFSSLGCESDRIKAFKLGCNGSTEIVLLDEEMDYVCQESFSKKCNRKIRPARQELSRNV